MPMNSMARRSRYAAIPAFFTIGFTLLYIRVFVNQVTVVSLPYLLDIGLLIAGAFFLFAHCFERIDAYGKNMGWVLAILLGTAYLYAVTGETAPFVVALVLVSAASLDNVLFTVKLWFALTAGLAALLVVVYSAVLLMHPDSLLYFYRRENGYLASTRLSFFFNHPNMAAALALSLLGVILLFKSERFRFLENVVLLGIALTVFFTTGSRTSFILMLVLITLFWLQNVFSILDRPSIRFLLKLLPIALFVVTYLLAGPIYTPERGGWFTGRVWLWHVCLQNQGPTLLGQAFQPSTAVTLNGWLGTASTLDSFYADCIFEYGLLFSCLFCYLVWKSFSIETDYMHNAAPLIVVMLLFGFCEGHVLNIVICPALYLMIPAIRDLLVSQQVDSMRENTHLLKSVTNRDVSQFAKYQHTV